MDEHSMSLEAATTEAFLNDSTPETSAEGAGDLFAVILGVLGAGIITAAIIAGGIAAGKRRQEVLEFYEKNKDKINKLIEKIVNDYNSVTDFLSKKLDNTFYKYSHKFIKYDIDDDNFTFYKISRSDKESMTQLITKVSSALFSSKSTCTLVVMESDFPIVHVDDVDDDEDDDLDDDLTVVDRYDVDKIENALERLLEDLVNGSPKTSIPSRVVYSLGNKNVPDPTVEVIFDIADVGISAT